MKSKMKRRVKLVALANLVMASCWGWSCTTDMRDAVWGGAMDYLTGLTADTLGMTFSADDLFPVED